MVAALQHYGNTEIQKKAIKTIDLIHGRNSHNNWQYVGIEKNYK